MMDAVNPASPAMVAAVVLWSSRRSRPRYMTYDIRLAAESRRIPFGMRPIVTKCPRSAHAKEQIAASDRNAGSRRLLPVTSTFIVRFARERPGRFRLKGTRQAFLSRQHRDR